jgi:glycerol-3-phosphate dehydrogenase
LQPDDVLCTFSGIRPVIGTGKADPSRESRDHAVWEENGLLTVTGGKLTTFRLIALDALKALESRLAKSLTPNRTRPPLDAVRFDRSVTDSLNPALRRRLLGTYGADVPELLAAGGPDEMELIPQTPYLWAELRWAARAEGVVHLDDLLLRRVRLGLFLPRGGDALLPRIGSICRSELGWDSKKWKGEAEAYRALWRRCYSLPDAEKDANAPTF